MTEDPEEEIAIEVDDPLSEAISRFNIDDSVPKIAYHPAVARRWNAPWQFMSDFDIPVVLFCDDFDNHGAPHRIEEYSYYPDLLQIEHVAIDGQVIKDEYSSAHHDPSLIYKNRLIYRGDLDANDGINDLPFIDLFYIDYRFGISTPNADRIREEYDVNDDVVREIVEYCYHIKDGGLLIVENSCSIMDDLERRIPNIRFEVDGSRASNRFGRISIEYLGEYRLKTGQGARDKVEVFKIHSEVKFEKPDNFLAKCFVDINWD